MATSTPNDPHKIQIDSKSEGESLMEIDSANSSSVDSSESDRRNNNLLIEFGRKLHSNHIPSPWMKQILVFHRTETL